jgi:hypothetical protein
MFMGGNLFLRGDIANQFPNQNITNEPVKLKIHYKTTIIHPNWEKIASTAAKMLCDSTGVSFVVDNMIALGEQNETEQIMLELHESEKKLNKIKESGTINMSEWKALQKEIETIEKKGENLSEMTQTNLKVPINKLFQSIEQYYHECKSKKTITGLVQS